MFQVNDNIMYGTLGVCNVTNISMQTVGGIQNECYTLHPLFENNCTIKIPVNNSRIDMRKIISKSESDALIESMPNVELFWFVDDKIRREEYRKALKSGDCNEWAKLIKTLSLKKKEMKENGKKLGKTDEDAYDLAEKLLFGELSVTLQIPFDKVNDYILKKMSLNVICD